MNARERFLATMSYGTPDRVPYWEIIGYWGEVLERWQDEGMPGDVHIAGYFGLDRRESVPISLGIAPLFKVEVLSEDERTTITRGSDGVVRRTLKSMGKEKHQTIPQFVRFPIETREDFSDFKKRLNPKSLCRYPLYWEDYKRTLEGRDYPLSIHAGSVFGWLRNWMGLENIALMLYDDKAFVQEMMEYLADFIIETIHPALDEIKEIDFAVMWEDMCYKGGSMISPEHFKELMVPQYKRITSLLREHGIDIILVDCDGNHDELNSLWLEGGLTGVYPLECAAGEDVVALRKEYGKDLHLVGGIDKRVLAKDKKAIEEEVMSKVPLLLEKGGWIPSIDHAVPPDVPFENYCYYWELVRKISEPR
jgi:uroporphyrinogen decarboxylase